MNCMLARVILAHFIVRVSLSSKGICSFVLFSFFPPLDFLRVTSELHRAATDKSSNTIIKDPESNETTLIKYFNVT